MARKTGKQVKAKPRKTRRSSRAASASAATPAEVIVSGLGVSPGIVIGTAYLRETGTLEVPEYEIPENGIEDECDRFRAAVSRAARQVRRLRAKAETLPGSAGEELAYLLEAYGHMLKGSRLLRGVEKRITENRMNAEAAVQAELTELSAGFAEMDDAYLAARLDDIRHVAHRLIRSLTKTPYRSMSELPEGSIVVAEELTPADTAQMDPRRIHGFATVLGGAEGHVAIMARALGLPAVAGATGIMSAVKTGDTLVIDGDGGRIIVNPGAATLVEVGRRRAERLSEEKKLVRLRRVPAVTRDGVEIQLNANVELPLEMDMVDRMGARGIGLLRTEFMFMNRDDLPSEDEQYALFRDIVGKMKGSPVTIRTLDIGGEKIAQTLLGDIGESVSSALGLRGVRLSLKRTDVLETQFAAILRAGKHGPVRILLPMVSTVAEVRKAREILKKVAARLKRRKVAMAEALPPLGVMIEVPGAALSADALAMASDFFAIGSNDLTMYTLAIDRSDEQVAYLYNPLHPAVLRLVQFATMAALRARIPISVCGEMAGDPRFTVLLLGLGIRDLSMVPANIPRIKQRVRELDMVEANRRAGAVMEQIDSGRIAMLLDDFNGLSS
ncbi:MAG: phosphoenolpyruvate--protein phosphotransferase [Rhodospirillales bacterium]|nr:phosphoenolpyruvate--protein phosphotransferase [Rhodospirillales bacterium]MCW8970545.1 phosphoenolpyruvate--protein phosphotransferase [Rhodospirillales bacterium]